MAAFKTGKRKTDRNRHRTTATSISIAKRNGEAVRLRTKRKKRGRLSHIPRRDFLEGTGAVS